MRNMFYLMTRYNIKELNKEQDGLGYFLLMMLLVMGFIIDTAFLPISTLLSLLIKRDVSLGVNE